MFGKSLNQSASAFLSIGALLLLVMAGSISVSAQPRKGTSFGLGVPSNASTGGATRGSLPQVVMLVPDNGAKTLSDRPTFYFYVGEAPFRATFLLRDGNEQGSKSVHRIETEAKKAGLYRVTLPEAVRLNSGQVQRWQVRWQDGRGVNQIDVAAAVKLESNPQVRAKIAGAKNDLEKARIFSANLYWYDALDAYTRWLEANPTDKTARQERSELIRIGLENNSAVADKRMDINVLLTTIDRNPPQQIALSNKD